MATRLGVLMVLVVLATAGSSSAAVRHAAGRRGGDRGGDGVSRAHRKLIARIAMETVDEYFREVDRLREEGGLDGLEEEEEEGTSSSSRRVNEALSRLLRDQLKGLVGESDQQGDDRQKVGPDLAGTVEDLIDYLAQSLEEVADHVVRALGDEVADILDRLERGLEVLSSSLSDQFPDGIPIKFDDDSRAAFYSIRDSIDHLVIIMSVCTVIFGIVSILHSAERLYLMRLGRKVVNDKDVRISCGPNKATNGSMAAGTNFS